MKVAIIGSGVGGLSTALRLNKLGLEVTVFEKNNFYGGKLAEFESKGYRFDKGPSLFTMPYLVDELFELYQKNPKDYFNYHTLKIACNYFDGENRLTAYTQADKFAEEVENKLQVPKQVIQNYLDNAKELLRLSSPMFISDNKTFMSWVGIKMAISALKNGVFTSLNEFNQKKLKHPFLVKIFNRFVTYNGSNPYLTPGILSSISSLEHKDGAYFPIGGMVEIPNSLLKLAHENGIKFQLNSKVEKVTKTGNDWTINVNNKDHKFDLVVFNGDYFSFKNIGKNLTPGEIPENNKLSSSALVFYWGINREFKELDVHNIFFAKNYQEEFSYQSQQKHYTQDPTIYVHISSKVESNDAPPNAENWFVFVNVPPGEIPDEIIQAYRKTVLKKLGEYLKTNIEQHLEMEEMFTPQLIQSITSAHKGALYGLNSNGINNIFARPGNKGKEKGLYFVGGTVFPGGGIPMCLNSAKVTSRQIKKDYHL